MDRNAYIVKRVGTAKLIGFVIGLVPFFMIPVIWPDQGLTLRVGLLMWYTTFGAIIGVLGMFDEHPLLKCPLKFWVRGPVIGAWLNLVIAFLMYDKLAVLVPLIGGPLAGLKSPFWVVLPGAVVGLLIDAIATKFTGEGWPAQD